MGKSGITLAVGDFNKSDYIFYRWLQGRLFSSSERIAYEALITRVVSRRNSSFGG
ncbi:hypothetical protein FGIG_11584 [Fasciola gigantica]|uniref:Uncharacterized protein n=1 Tax=Fasciola gigantica TaxID=46835 RepID=A0A504Z3A1_FASGI|nr:hypothetical protein FGIG_11584 [Fasciola gigantica]